MKDFLSQNPLVPVFYHDDVDYCKRIIQACYDGGIRIFEYTNRGPKALKNFRELVVYVHTHCDGMKIGIGTIFTTSQALEFIDAGCEFVVQPCMDAQVGAVCLAHDIPWIPGVMTPTEIHNALKTGAGVVKIFPGSAVSPSYIKALLGPFKELKVMVTGGVNATDESVGEWIGAGATAVGLGSQLFKNDDPESIKALIQGLLKNL